MGAHSMLLTKECDTQYLWIAELGAKRDQKFGYDYDPPEMMDRKGKAPAPAPLPPPATI